MGQAYLNITPERQALFLEVLAKTGSVNAACRATATEDHGPRAGKSSWHDHRRRNPKFAEAWDNALIDALGTVEDEIMRRAMNPAKTPVTNRKGDVIGEREDRLSSDRLLLRMASRLDPEAWAERRRQDSHVTGEIRHQAQLALAPADILVLPEAKQRVLIALLEEIMDRKAGLDPAKKLEASNDAETD